MANSLQILEERRRAFNELAARVIPPRLQNDQQVGFTEKADYISDPATRKRFRDLAVAMLEASITHHRADATLQAAPSPNKHAVVASTLVISGVVLYLVGTAAALVAAGIWYWFAASTAARRIEDLARHAEIHNEMVPEWRETLKRWETERDELMP